jgi:hypothetical protein
MKAARARCAAATKARADNYQDLMREQKETEEMIAQEAERDAKRKISKKNSDSTRSTRHRCPCNNSLCAIYTRRYAAMGSPRSNFFSFPRPRISGASSGHSGIDKSEDEYDPNLDDQDDEFENSDYTNSVPSAPSSPVPIKINHDLQTIRFERFCFHFGLDPTVADDQVRLER